MEKQYTALSLFSGGLDSLLASRMVQAQGIRVLGLHFISPFFGKPHLIHHWEQKYGLDILPVDIGEKFVQMLLQRPEHGFGKTLNPCVDCKILMMRAAKALLASYGASFLISGEVLGQRPMSQRRDTLNVIRRDAEVKDLLLRPLSAQLLDPTPMELAGLLDRSRLGAMSGRGRKGQLALAAELGIHEIPTPAGGCMLTEKENASRYWPVLTQVHTPRAADFYLANLGRQYWHGACWLAIGRNAVDNEKLEKCACVGDYLFKVADFSGPLGLGRKRENTEQSERWSQEELELAAAFVASFSPCAVRLETAVQVRIWRVDSTDDAVREASQPLCVLTLMPAREAFTVPDWLETRQALKAADV